MRWLVSVIYDEILKGVENEDSIDEILKHISATEEELNEEKLTQKKGTYKNADLLKMHAYKDAIRRTGGAYVLYPGTEQTTKIGFHEILPGLGAFSVKPSKTHVETKHLEVFIDEVIEHFINRATQREHLASKTYNVHKNSSPNNLSEPIPEYIGGEKLIPDET